MDSLPVLTPFATSHAYYSCDLNSNYKYVCYSIAYIYILINECSIVTYLHNFIDFQVSQWVDYC